LLLGNIFLYSGFKASASPTRYCGLTESSGVCENISRNHAARTDRIDFTLNSRFMLHFRIPDGWFMYLNWLNYTGYSW